MANGSAPSSYWVVRAGRESKWASEFETLGLVAIGFPPVGDVTGKSRAQVVEMVAACRPAKREKIAGEAGMLFRFATKMMEGDVVITPDGSTRELLFGRIVGPYEFRGTAVVGEFQHVRSVQWVGRRPRDGLPKRVLYSLGAISTIFKPGGQEHLRSLMEGTPVEDPSSEDEEGGDSGDDLFADIQSRSEELIRSRLSQLDGYEMQDLEASILRAMGYHTTVSPPGADRGVDIIASRDPLGIEQPVKVQVKAKPTAKSGTSDVRELAGVLGQGERGIFVSSGGFTREAMADPSASRIVLIDGEQLQSLLVEYYDRLGQDSKSLVPLRRLYFPN